MPVRISIFFFEKLLTTTFATSGSRPGKIFGAPSRIVTCDPRSTNVDANSQPIAPPPMTAIRFGIVLNIRTSSEVMIDPPIGKPLIVRGTEPLAKITFVA